MRKSLPKPPPSGLRSGLAPLRAGLLAGGARHASEGNGSVNGRASALAPIAPVNHEAALGARLCLLEGFLSRTEIADCAQHGLRWVGEMFDVGRAMCLVRPTGGPALSAVASSGFASTARTAFSVLLDDWRNPLVNVLNNRRATYFAPAHSATDRRRRPVTPFEDCGFHVVPLGVTGFSEDTFGLLMLEDVAEVGDELCWFTSVLSQKLDQILRQQALSEGDRLKLIIDSVADPIVVTGANGATSLMNEPAERLFTARQRAGAVEHRRVRSNGAHFSSFIEGMLVSADQRRVGEIGLVDPHTGGAMPVEAIAGKILSDHGGPTAVVTILHDRREALEKAKLYEQLKQAFDELEQKVRAATADIAQQNELLRRQAIELEQASALKSQFLANMSHEFRTPLNAMLGYTSMLLQGVAGPLDSAQKRQLGRIESNGRHLLTIVSEILDISRIEAGRMPLQLSKFRLPDLAREVRAELEPIILRRKLNVAVDLRRDLPPLMSDRQKVKQILLNLLSNALKFTHHGGVTISARRVPRERAVRIAVADTGIGIAPADQDRIFEDFRQLDNSPTRAYGGTGLGLSICRRLAQMLGGRISVESRVGEGSTFTLTIPVQGRR